MYDNCTLTLPNTSFMEKVNRPNEWFALDLLPQKVNGHIHLTLCLSKYNESILSANYWVENRSAGTKMDDSDMIAESFYGPSTLYVHTRNVSFPPPLIPLTYLLLLANSAETVDCSTYRYLGT